MKRSFFIMITLSVVLSVFFKASGHTSQLLISADDRALLDSAVRLVDNGEAKKALKIFDKLSKRYKDNYLVEYERLYAVYYTGDYKRAAKEGTKLLDHSAADDKCYQLVGNAYDNMGKPDKAIEIYDLGLKKFPNSGSLYLEKGNVYMIGHNYDNALKNYTKGIEVSPAFDSNYYRMSLLYRMSTEQLWAIIYGETVYNITKDRARLAEVCRLVRDVYNENVKLCGDSLSITLSGSNAIYVSSDSSVMRVPFDLAYSVGVEKWAKKRMTRQTAAELSFDDLVELRQAAIEYVDSLLPDEYNVSLIDYQRSLIKSGNWYAYNIGLLANQDETQAWLGTDEGQQKARQYLAWREEHPFVPSADHPTLKDRQYKVEALDIPDPEDVSTAEGCRSHQADVLRLSNWYLEQPLAVNSLNRKRVTRFLMAWMANTPDYAFTILPNATLGHVELGCAYFAAMCKHAIEFGVSAVDEAMFCEVMLQMVDYYKRNKNAMRVVPSMEKYLDMDGATLRDTLASEYRAATAGKE